MRLQLKIFLVFRNVSVFTDYKLMNMGFEVALTIWKEAAFWQSDHYSILIDITWTEPMDCCIEVQSIYAEVTLYDREDQLWSVGQVKHIEGSKIYVSRINAKNWDKCINPLILLSFREASALLLQTKIMETHSMSVYRVLKCVFCVFASNLYVVYQFP